MRLRGVLSTAFDNGILCMRGFARAEYLAAISKVDVSYQREIKNEHQDEIQAYFKRGHYRFFPELVLGVSLEELGCADAAEDMACLRASVESGQGFSIRPFGGRGVRISAYAQGHTAGDAFEGSVVSLSVIGFPTDESERLVYRIDGNHRLSAIEEIQRLDELEDDCLRMQVPYCLIIFDTKNRCQEQSSVFFHNINFNQLPVPEDRLLQLVINNCDRFRDDVLKEDPSFGAPYFWARNISSRCRRLEMRYKAIFPELEKYWEIFLVRLCSMLTTRSTEIPDSTRDIIEDGRLVRRGCSEGTVMCKTEDADLVANKVRAALEMVLDCIHSPLHYPSFEKMNGEVLAALVYETCRSVTDLSQFVSWFEANRFARLQGSVLDAKDSFRRYIRADDMVDMYEEFAKQESNTIFLSMAFGKPETENHYMVIKRVVDEINREYKPVVPLVLRRVDYMDQGYSYEINHKISEAIAGCGLLIANLTYMNPNVYHEVGLAMGGSLAKTQDPGRNLLLILDMSVSSDKCEVGFNLWSYRQIRFNQTEILGQRIKREIAIHFGLLRSC